MPLCMRPPKNGKLAGVPVGALLQVVGAIYGLVNSPRLWFSVIAGWLVNEDGWVQRGRRPEVSPGREK